MRMIVTEMATAAAGEDIASRLSDAGVRLVCFYQAPWDFDSVPSRDGDDAEASGSVDAWLEQWDRYHAALLRAVGEAPDRVVLVNLARAGTREQVVERLDGLGIALEAHEVPAAPDVPEWARTLAAAHFAELAPEAWEIYEALESRAQVTGDEPELRGTMGLGEVADLAWVLGRLQGGLRDVADARHECTQLASDLEHAVTRMEALEDGANSRRRENDLLLEQIEEFNSELDRVEAARAASEAALKDLREQVELEAAQPVDDELPALRRENELLVLQLEQLHEELGQSAMHARAASEVARRATLLGERARLAISRLALNSPG